MRPTLFLIPLLLSSAACNETSDKDLAGRTPSPVANATVSTSATASASASSSGAKGVAVAVSEKTGDYEFDYSYPAAAGGPAVLRAYLDTDLATAKAGLAKDSAEWRKEAKKEGFPFHPYASSTKWQVVADLPDWLSLSSEVWVFTGGAHGNSGFDSLVFDRRANVIRKPMDLFRSSGALWNAVEKRWCAGLDQEREKKRGAPVDRSDNFASACPGIDELNLLLGSSNGKTFDRLTLRAAPYVAGPYVEGAYDVNIDFDAAIVAAAKPEFAKSFAIHR